MGLQNSPCFCVVSSYERARSTKVKSGASE